MCNAQAFTCSISEKRGSRKKERNKKPAEYLTLLKRSLTEKPAGLVAYMYRSEYFPVILHGHSSCPYFAYAA
jgi:hypothetical protein